MMQQYIGTPCLWAIFTAVVGVLLCIDIGLLYLQTKYRVAHEKNHVFTVLVILVAMCFAAGLYVHDGFEPALAFGMSYVVELMLSVDNLFVFMLIFSHFRVPIAQQQRVLFWGILGALVMRGAFIATGIALIEKFHWIFYIFGSFLVFTGIKMLVKKLDDSTDDTKQQLPNNTWMNLYNRLIPSTQTLHGNHFVIRLNGRLLATPLLLVLIIIELSDVVFALDSIPATFAVTVDPFLVYSSNIFAILGLRSLYFVLAALLQKIHYLDYSLGAILAFIGGKMLIHDIYTIPNTAAMLVVFAFLGIAAILSYQHSKSKH